MKFIKHGNIYAPACGAQCPVVDDLGDRWRVYYAGRRTGCGHPETYISFFDIEPDNPAHIIYDHKLPILDLGLPGTFDEHGMMPTSIVNFRGQKWLYYIGWSRQVGTPYKNGIGVALILKDKARRYSTGPIIYTSHLNPYFVGTFGVKQHLTMLRGFYMSCTEWRKVHGKMEPRYTIKEALSTDGVQWGLKKEWTLFYKSKAEGGICSATLIDEDTMLYCYRSITNYRGGNGSYQIGKAIRTKFGWRRKDQSATIKKGDKGWDSDMVCYPYFFNDLIFYNGNGFGKSGIGYASVQR